MDFDFFEDLDCELECNKDGQEIVDIYSNELDELSNKLDIVEEFTIDRFEEDKVVLENRLTGNILDVNREDIPQEAKEGDILKYIDGKYILDKEETLEIEDRIKNKMDQLWD